MFELIPTTGIYMTVIIIITSIFVMLWTRFTDQVVKDKSGRPLPLPKPFIDMSAVRSTRSLVFISHPEYVKTILSGHYLKFPKSMKYKRLNFFLGEDGLVTSNGHVWQHHRHLINQGFHADSLKEMVGCFSVHANEFIEDIKKRMNNSKSLRTNVNKDIAGLTLAVISQAAFGFRIRDRSDSNQVISHFEVIADEIVLRLNDLTDWSHKLQPARVRKVTKVVDALNTILLEALDKRKSQRSLQANGVTNDIDAKTGPKDLVDILLDAGELGEREGGKGKGFTQDQIKQHALTFFIAGYDTTSSSISWILYELCLNPEIMKKCKNEIDSVFKELNLIDSVPYEAIPQFEYLTTVIKESLRLHPPAVTFGRVSTDEVLLTGVEENGQGYLMPKGTVFVTLVHSLHRHPDFWTNPDTFYPDRFSKDNIRQTLKHPFQYVPFSGGPRNCIGQRFAQMEMVVLLSILLHAFDFSLSSEDAKLMRNEEVLIQQPRNLFLRLTLREHDVNKKEQTIPTQ